MAVSATFVPEWPFYTLFSVPNNTFVLYGWYWMVRNIVRMIRNELNASPFD